MKYLLASYWADYYGYSEIADEFEKLMRIKIAQENNSEEITLDNTFGSYLFYGEPLASTDKKVSYTKQNIEELIKEVIYKFINHTNPLHNSGKEIGNHEFQITKYPELISNGLRLPIYIKTENKSINTYIQTELYKYFKTANIKIGEDFWTQPAQIIWNILLNIKEIQNTEIESKSILFDKIYLKQIEQSKENLSEKDYFDIKKMVISQPSLIGAPIQSLIMLNGAKASIKPDLSKVIKIFGNKSMDWIYSNMSEENKEYSKSLLKLFEQQNETTYLSKINFFIGKSLEYGEVHESAHLLPDNIKSIRGIDKLSTFLFQNSNKDKKQLKEITSSWEKLPLEIRKEAFTKGFDFILNYVRNNIAIHENATNVEFSRESNKWGIEDEDKYKVLEDYYKSSQNTPLPEWTKYSVQSGNYIGRFLPRNDPRGMYLGNHTNCCQHPEGAGSYCAFHGQGSPTGAFFVIEDSKKNILCQSWVWEDNKGDVVFDNAESILKEDDPRRNTFSNIYSLISQKLPVRNVYLGSSMNDITTEGMDQIKFEPQSLDKHDYSDTQTKNYLLSYKPYITTEVRGNYTNTSGELGRFKADNSVDKNQTFQNQPHHGNYLNWEDNYNIEDEEDTEDWEP